MVRSTLQIIPTDPDDAEAIAERLSELARTGIHLKRGDAYSNFRVFERWAQVDGVFQLTPNPVAIEILGHALSGREMLSAAEGRAAR